MVSREPPVIYRAAVCRPAIVKLEKKRSLRPGYDARGEEGGRLVLDLSEQKQSLEKAIALHGQSNKG